MTDFLFSDSNSIYLILAIIILVIALLEGMGALLGISISSLLDNVIPSGGDFELPDGAFTKLLGWMCLGKLPLLIWLILLMANLSISGLFINYLVQSIFGEPLPLMLSLPIAIISSSFLTRLTGSALSRVMPKNESSAQKVSSFSGGVATITIGTARLGSPAEACFIDTYKQKHYLMVEPIKENEVFQQGQKVVLIEKQPDSWKASLLRSNR